MGRSRSGSADSVPVAAAALSAQKPASTAMPSETSGCGDPMTDQRTWGAVRRKARRGSHGHDRNRATMVVPTSAVPRNAIVTRLPDAPRTGGAARTATSPKAATTWVS